MRHGFHLPYCLSYRIRKPAGKSIPGQERISADAVHAAPLILKPGQSCNRVTAATKGRAVGKLGAAERDAASPGDLVLRNLPSLSANLSQRCKARRGDRLGPTKGGGRKNDHRWCKRAAVADYSVGQGDYGRPNGPAIGYAAGTEGYFTYRFMFYLWGMQRQLPGVLCAIGVRSANHFSNGTSRFGRGAAAVAGHLTAP